MEAHPEYGISFRLASIIARRWMHIPSDTFNLFTTTTKYPNIHFDFHAHNDYDLSIANVDSHERELKDYMLR
jgi:hypothetical protein